MKSIYSFCFALCSLFFLRPALSQSTLLDAQVSFAERTAPIHFFLLGMESATAITFSYGKEVPVQRAFHMTPEKRSIREHLDAMFENDSLDYMERGRKILIVPAKTQSQKKVPSQTLRGRILDLDSNAPLIGVNIPGIFQVRKCPGGKARIELFLHWL